MNTRKLALIAVFASTYVVIGTVFHSISFDVLQVRVSNAMIPLIALYGDSMTYGLFAGHIALNLTSPFLPLDLLSPVIMLPAKYLIQRYGLKMIPLHVICVAVWVGYMLHTILTLPLIETMSLILFGELIAEYVLGVTLYYALIRTGLSTNT